MRLINLTVLVLFVASAMVTVPAYAAPGGNKGDEGGGALNYVGWTTTTFTGDAGATVMNAECIAKFGAGSRWATASESFTGAPDLSEFASEAEAWVRDELIGGFVNSTSSRVYLYKAGSASADVQGCNRKVNAWGSTMNKQGSIGRQACSGTYHVACVGP